MNPNPGPAGWALFRRRGRFAPWELQSRHGCENDAYRAMLRALAGRDRYEDPRDWLVRKLTPAEVTRLDRLVLHGPGKPGWKPRHGSAGT
jgi:hypothetical protein